jgi:hypothetical protein
MDGEYDTFVRDGNVYSILGRIRRGNISKFIFKTDVKYKDVN